MRFATRPRVIVILAGLALFSAIHLGATRCPDVFPEMAQAGSVREQFPDDAQRGEELDRNQQTVLARIRAKNGVAANLVAGSTTLAEAASQFRQICSDCPEYFDRLRCKYPGLTEDEMVCRNVIAFAVATIDQQLRLAAALRGRLERELAMLHPPHTDALPR